MRTGKWITVGRADAVPEGRGATVKLKDNTEVALFNVGGRFFAVENFCPHKSYPLADSPLFGHIVECTLHNWRFDVRTGECFTTPECAIERYEVRTDDGLIKIEI